MIVNGNPTPKATKPARAFEPVPVVPKAGPDAAAQGTRDLLLEMGPRKFADWVLKQRRLLITDTTFRDAHQSLMATRVRSTTCWRVRMPWPGAPGCPPGLFSLEMWGGATFDTAMRFLNEDPWERLRQLRTGSRTSASRCCSADPTRSGIQLPDHVVAGFVKHAAASGMDIFRIFDSLNYLPICASRWRPCSRPTPSAKARCATRATSLDPQRDKFAKYYVKLAKELERGGAPDCDQGHGGTVPSVCRPEAGARPEGRGRVPIHFHTHDTSGVNAASVLRASDAGWMWWISRLRRCRAAPRSRTSTRWWRRSSTRRGTPSWTSRR